MVGLAMTAVAAASWAGLDATRKVLVQRVSGVALLVLLTLGQLPLFVAWMVVADHSVHGVGYWLPGAGSVVLNFVANLLFFRAVSVSPLSLTVPLLAFVPVFSVGAAFVLLGERPEPRALTGIALVVGGALVLNAGAAEQRGPLALARALLRERGSLPMLGVAVCWSLTIVVDKLATEHAGYGAHGALLNAGLGALGVGVLAVRGQLRQLSCVRDAWAPWLLAVALGALGLGAQLIAVQTVLVSVVEAIKRAVGVIASVVVGRLKFGEPVGVAKVLAVSLMSAGALLIVLE